MIQDRYAGFTVEQRDDGVCVVTLNRPEKRNGLSRAIKRDLIELLTQLSYSKRFGALVIAAIGDFCAGDDVSPGGQDDWTDAVSQPITRDGHDSISTYSALRAISQALVRGVRDCDLVTIAAVDGYAIQSGLSLALACDFCITAPEAKLGSATLRMGFLPDEGGHYLLVEHLGVRRAKDFLLRQRIVGSDEALALGLVNEVVPSADALMPRALALAAEMAASPRAATRLLKHAVDHCVATTFEQAAIDIAARAAIADHHPDAREGRAAFLAKPRRRPRFNQD